MPTPKVLLLARWFPPTIGGIEKYLEELYARLAESTDVYVVVPYGHGGIPGRPYHVTMAPRLSRNLGSKVPVLGIAAKALKLAYRADVIVAGHILTAVPAILLGRSLRRPTIVHVYGMELHNDRLMRLKTFFLRRADRVVSISDHTTARLRGLGVREDQIVEVPPGVDVATFRPGTRSSVAPLTILTVGRLEPTSRYKGHDVLSSAVRAMKEEGLDVQWRIVGDGPDMPYVRAMVRSKNIESSVTFLGSVSQKQLVDEYQRAHIMVMPNREGPNGETEGFGMVFTEAQACGTPVLAGVAGGTATAVCDGVGGWRVDGSDPQEVTARLREVSSSPEGLEAAGRRGRDWVVERHSWASRAGRMQQLLETLAAPNNKVASRASQ